MHAARAAVVGAVACAFAAAPAGTQVTSRSPPTPIDRYTVDQWTTDHGLPQNSVNAIAQTADGYLWLGTSGGIARFDGIRFTELERRDATGSYLDRVVSFSLGAGGALWIATENGLLRYHEGGFTAWRQSDGLPGMLVNGLHADADGTAHRPLLEPVRQHVPHQSPGAAVRDRDAGESAARLRL